jgi:hypothetical protein
MLHPLLVNLRLFISLTTCNSARFLLNTARFCTPLRIFIYYLPPSSPYRHRPSLRPTTPTSARFYSIPPTFAHRCAFLTTSNHLLHTTAHFRDQLPSPLLFIHTLNTLHPLLVAQSPTVHSLNHLQFLLNTARFSSLLCVFNHIQPPSPYQHRPF